MGLFGKMVNHWNRPEYHTVATTISVVKHRQQKQQQHRRVAEEEPSVAAGRCRRRRDRAPEVGWCEAELSSEQHG